VAKHDTAIVHGNGGVLSAQSTVILGGAGDGLGKTTFLGACFGKAS
jgi:hypothetical protein